MFNSAVHVHLYLHYCTVQSCSVTLSPGDRRDGIDEKHFMRDSSVGVLGDTRNVRHIKAGID